MCVAAMTLFSLVLPHQLAAQQTVSATNGQIAFTQGDPNAPSPTAVIFIVNPDGSHQQQVPLGNSVEFFSNAIWSPDGSKLLIGHTVRLDDMGQCCLFQPATVNPDGSDFNQLSPPNPVGTSSAGMDCGAWFPDQTRILCGIGDGVFSIRVSDGGDPVRLTTNPFAANGGTDSPTSISPNGKRFVFIRSKLKLNPNDASPDSQVALFVENVDGTGLQQLSANGKFKLGFLTSPVAHWSPDGKQIIAELGNGKLFTIQPDGTALNSIDLQVTVPYHAFEPAWSPDGKRIIFGMLINGGEGIFTANPDGSDVIQVTFTTNFQTSYNGPNWGTQLAAK
jgi:Tol biopolymer transport system component